MEEGTSQLWPVERDPPGSTEFCEAGTVEGRRLASTAESTGFDMREVADGLTLCPETPLA